MKKSFIKIPILVFVALVLLSAISFFLPFAPAQAVDIPEYWGVFVGVTDYRYINDLHYAAENAEEMYQVFSSAWGTDHTQILTDSQAKKADILAAIGWMAANADVDDTVLFDFSGHGAAGGYICPYDSSPFSYAYEISAAELTQSIQQIQAGKIVIILDSCYSGYFNTALSKINRVLLLATRPTEVGWETTSLHNLVFTYFLLDAIANYNESDANLDYELTAEELFQYAAPLTSQYEVENGFETIQHPIIDDHYLGELSLLSIFAFNVNIHIPADIGVYTIDGANYPLSTGTQYLLPGSAHAVTVPQMIDPGNGTRYVFINWSDGATSLNRPIFNGSYTVNYSQEELLTLNSDVDAVNGAGWYTNGSRAYFSAISYLETADTRYHFTGWSGDFQGTSLMGSLVMNDPKTVIANWRYEYLLSLESTYGNVTGAGWYTDGSNAIISLASTYVETADTRRVFSGWSGDYTGSDTMFSLLIDSPKTVAANWDTEYLLTLNSEYGTTVGAGWYDEGATVSFSVTTEQGFLVRHIFAGWSGDFTGMGSTAEVTMDSPKVINAIWRADYTQLYILILIVVLVVGAIVTVIILVHKRKAGV